MNDHSINYDIPLYLQLQNDTADLEHYRLNGFYTLALTAI